MWVIFLVFKLYTFRFPFQCLRNNSVSKISSVFFPLNINIKITTPFSICANSLEKKMVSMQSKIILHSGECLKGSENYSSDNFISQFSY